MLTKQTAALRIQRELAEAEVAADDLFAKIAALGSTMATARTQVGVKSRTGQKAFMRLARAQESISSATTDLHCVHGELSKINRKIRAMPDENGECPKENPFTTAEHVRSA